MKHKSSQQAKLERDNHCWRTQLIEDIGHCQMPDCIGHWPRNLTVHEITRGTARSKAYSERLACMVVCSWCNGETLTDASLWPQERQVALQCLLLADTTSPDEIIRVICDCRGDKKIQWPDVAKFLALLACQTL